MHGKNKQKNAFFYVNTRKMGEGGERGKKIMFFSIRQCMSDTIEISAGAVGIVIVNSLKYLFFGCDSPSLQN